MGSAAEPPSASTVVDVSDKQKIPLRRSKKKVKMMMRRLPPCLTETELLEKVSSPPGIERMWFRQGEIYLEDDAFPSAFFVFNSFDCAAEFQKKYNGQVFVDSEGHESAVFVEKAPNQDYSKDPLAPKPGVRPITEDIGYLKFMEEAEAKAVTKKVDFDVLVNEIIDRERKLAQGVCQETPLTDFFVKKAHEKMAKNRAKILNKKAEKVVFSKKEKTFPKETSKPVKEPRKEKPVREPKPKKEFKERPRPKQDREETASGTKEFASSFGDEKKKRIRPPRKPKPERVFKEKEEKTLETDAAPQASQSTGKTVPSTPSSTTPSIPSNDKPNAKTDRERRPIGPSQRNKDRPERALYQPGRSRKQKPPPTTKPEASGRPSAATNVPQTE